MGIKYIGDLPTYSDCYHFIGATKYRKEVFLSEEKREKLSQIATDALLRGGDCEVIAITVAYNHIHVLLKTKRELSKVGMVLFGSTSRLMRQEYPELKEEIKDGLWGGKSCTYIKDNDHLQNCKSYIERHQPDNTKV
ncbi:transposase [Clostridium celatum]|uniref:transposase n=1 Tax=Clostridium celatum TaxID=36834 RepID=UPI00290379E9|nr:transposase [Clostridium celatum]MDU2265241.1 transposase [Clostridium celatum]MDU6295967.1 transposase [Clostridium celatum]